MKTLISVEAIQYIYDIYVAECTAKKLPAQNKLTEKQQTEIFGIIKSATNTVFGKKLYPTIIHQVSFILYSLIKNHILLDGNKRFSLILTLYILKENHINCAKMTSEDWEMLVMRIASDVNYSLDKTIKFLKHKLL